MLDKEADNFKLHRNASFMQSPNSIVGSSLTKTIPEETKAAANLIEKLENIEDEDKLMG